jgi:polyribonucleotide nucleotidyltransferase
LFTEIKNVIGDRLETILFDTNKTKQEKDFSLYDFTASLKKELVEKGFDESKLKLLNLCLEEITNELLHTNILEKDQRPDGRKTNEIRAIDTLIDILPRTHGSALFVRGDTQALSVTTLGAPKETLTLQGMEISEEKRYFHQYNFPGYSVGELSKNRGGQNRREIGHGALAEKALRPVIPTKEIFPYTIRVVSEVLSSNGSSSMASTCGSTLSLMTAGVPILAPVAGIAMGIISGKDKYKILTDIQGPEDHYGDMDFKVAGTKDGVTALQMDVKIDGVTPQILKEALDQAKEARLFLLDKITATIPAPRAEVSKYAPKIVTFQIDSTRIGEVIGSGGKMINKITEETGTDISFDDDGTVYITGPDKEAIDKAQSIVQGIVKKFEIGEVVEGTVMELKDFGAIIDLGAYQSGLLHISELLPTRVEKVEDVVKLGDKLKLKVKNVENGKISLSLKDITHPGESREENRPFERRPGGFNKGPRKPRFYDHR